MERIIEMKVFHQVLILMHAIFMVQAMYLLVEIEEEGVAGIVDRFNNLYDHQEESRGMGNYCVPVMCNLSLLYLFIHKK